MKLNGDVVGHYGIATRNSSNPCATHAKRPRRFDVLVSAMLLALLVTAIASNNSVSGEIGDACADRQSYFASAVDFVMSFGV